MRKIYVLLIFKDVYVLFYVCLIFVIELRGNWLSFEWYVISICFVNNGIVVIVYCCVVLVIWLF